MGRSRRQTLGRTLAGAALGVLLLAGCAGTRHLPAGQPAPVAVPPAPTTVAVGQAYEVVAADSLLTIRVYRGGTLARMGHNHVIASHDLTGTARIPDDLTAASFEVRVPVGKLTVDEPELRTAEQSGDFPPEVPESAREGTRRNMLGEALLDAEHYPEIVLQSDHIEVTGPNELTAHVRVTVRDHVATVAVPLHHEIKDGAFVASGEFALNQSDLGLTPFSVMMGALQVVDGMNLRLSIRCLPAAAGT